MPDFLQFTRRQLDFALQIIGEATYIPLAPLEIRAWRTPEPVPFARRMSGQELHLKVGNAWGALFDCAWFRFNGTVPVEAAGRKVVLLLDVNGEMCVFDDQGQPVRGLTNVASEFDKSLGLPGKRVLPLFDVARGGEAVEVWADAGANDLFGFLQENGQIKEAWVAACQEEVRGLYYDMEVLLDSLKVLPENAPRHQQILRALHDAVHAIWNGVDEENACQARKILAPVLKKQGGDTGLEITAFGHAHIDLAWLWPLRETRRKGARTFATALANMDLYPDYVFAASQPQLFQWIKEDYPELYERIREKVREGRLEPQGALWVECDTNVTSGESLVRQILYGRKFFLEEFGVDSSYVWLPDTFGYSAALPQILRKAGIRYFSTQKLSWSLINRFPHHSFHWQGVDGTPVLVHMLPEENYNSPALPRSIGKIEAGYAEKGVSSHSLMVYGIGDGGGGPGEEHLERLERLKHFAGLSPVRQERGADFFPRWAVESDRFPTWVGELYLERHQGTLTTNARNKRYNRALELALRELEWLASMGLTEGQAEYPAQKLEGIWKEVLLYQFHDILPGSSIKRVYDESVARYQVLLAEVEEEITRRQDLLANRFATGEMRSPVLLWNSLSWERETWLEADGGWQRVKIPAMGCRVADREAAAASMPALFAAPDRLENDRLVARFDERGAVVSLVDKSSGREAIAPGERANRLAVFADPGDAWDFPMDYAASSPLEMELASARAWVTGPRAVLEQVYRLGHSELVLEISLEAGCGLLAFAARMNWREPRTMLRAFFPVHVFAEQAAFDIQFGHVLRPTHTNTTWDLAKDEVPAQKWVDLSQRDFGVALINDCKYGHRVKGHTLELNLLRSVPYTGPRLVEDADVAPGEPHPAFTDQVEHVFRYALMPHTGDWVSGGVIQAAYAFNIPVRTSILVPQSGQGSRLEHSWIKIDHQAVILESIKQAEDGSGVILRLYESTRTSTTARLHCGFAGRQIEEVDLLERPVRALPVNNGSVELEFQPFEIKTLKVMVG
jgi:alpha-mannosidase